MPTLFGLAAPYQGRRAMALQRCREVPQALTLLPEQRGRAHLAQGTETRCAKNLPSQGRYGLCSRDQAVSTGPGGRASKASYASARRACRPELTEDSVRVTEHGSAYVVALESRCAERCNEGPPSRRVVEATSGSCGLGRPVGPPLCLESRGLSRRSVTPSAGRRFCYRQRLLWWLGERTPLRWPAGSPQGRTACRGFFRTQTVSM